ncbi:unnamed protein product [Durusdinium trenchii]|uniref:SRCR domain-containing protein n=1 Tax=Durusdinium trenchii TaxID=1381693 RepID=A0ABP0MM97_9DINO
MFRWLLLTLLLEVGADGPPASTTGTSSIASTTLLPTTTTTTASTTTTSGTTTTTTTVTLPAHCQRFSTFTCSTSPVTPASTEVMLVEGSAAMPDWYCNGRWGRLEVKKDGVWGQVCRESFDHLDARVSCRQMGFQDGFALREYHYTGRLSMSVTALAWLDTFPAMPLLRRRGQHLRAAAGVLCLAEQLSESELRARCPKLRFKANDQKNKPTHPMSVVTIFPGNSYTSGFGGTGVSTSDGGLGNYAGTYRTEDEIRSAWSNIASDEVPNMGGHQWRYPFATKSFCYSNFLTELAMGYCESYIPTSAPTSSTSSSTTTSVGNPSGYLKPSKDKRSRDGTTQTANLDTTPGAGTTSKTDGRRPGWMFLLSLLAFACWTATDSRI